LFLGLGLLGTTAALSGVMGVTLTMAIGGADMPGNSVEGPRVVSVADPGCLSRIRNRIKEFKYFYPKKLFLSSRKYDPGSSSWIQILIFYPSLIPDPVVKKAPDPGSGSTTLRVGVDKEKLRDQCEESYQQRKCFFLIRIEGLLTHI
jgi:hypothetical protein